MMLTIDQVATKSKVKKSEYSPFRNRRVRILEVLHEYDISPIKIAKHMGINHDIVVGLAWGDDSPITTNGGIWVYTQDAIKIANFLNKDVEYIYPYHTTWMRSANLPEAIDIEPEGWSYRAAYRDVSHNLHITSLIDDLIDKIIQRNALIGNLISKKDQLLWKSLIHGVIIQDVCTEYIAEIHSCTPKFAERSLAWLLDQMRTILNHDGLDMLYLTN